VATSKRVQRLGPSLSTRDKISAALVLRRKTPEHKAKIALGRTGKHHSEETKAKIAASRKATASMTPQQRETLRRKRSGENKRWYRLCTKQMHADLLVALGIPDLALYRDVLRSQGWRRFREIFDPEGRVSDGFARGRVWWALKKVNDGQS